MAAILLHLQDQERNHLRRNRVFRDRTNPLDPYDDVDIKSRYRLTRQLIMDLYDLIGAELEPATMRNHAIPGMIQIFIALRYYATNSYYSLVGDSIGIHKCSVSRIVNRVTRAICRLSNRFIKFPTENDDVATTKRKFHDIADMPHVIGAIDGTLITIIKPHERENLYVSRLKRGHSLNVLATCNADMLLTNVVAKYPGSTNDSYIWNNSNLRELFQVGRYGDAFLIGDSGFGLSQYLLTPVMNAEENSEQRYNTSHKKTRQVIERCFALLKGRFRCLHKDTGKMKLDPKKCCQVIIACCVLHNMCVLNNLPAEDIDLEGNDENDDDENEHGMAADDVNDARRARAAGNVVRRRIIERFA